MRNDIEQLAEVYNLNPTHIITKLGDKFVSEYFLLNSQSDLELLQEDENYIKLNMTLETFARELFSIYRIKHSQQQEFFID